MTQQNVASVERNIQFFRVFVGLSESGEWLPFDPRPALTIIAHLVSTLEWYEEENDGNALCLLPLGFRGPYPVARFCRTRRTGIPDQERMGAISDLDLEEDAGLLESIHVVFLPDNVIGAEYNHYGPRISRLARYMHTKARDGQPRPTIGPVIRANPADQLDRLAELHSIEVAVVPSGAQAIEQVQQAPRGLQEAVSSLSRISPSPGSLQLVYRPTRDSESSFLQEMASGLKSLLGDETFRRGTSKMKVEGRRTSGSSLETLDLLQDEITAKKQMVKLDNRRRALNPEAAFQTIIETYEELRDEIAASSTVIGRKA